MLSGYLKTANTRTVLLQSAAEYTESDRKVQVIYELSYACLIVADNETGQNVLRCLYCDAPLKGAKGECEYCDSGIRMDMDKTWKFTRLKYL